MQPQKLLLFYFIFKKFYLERETSIVAALIYTFIGWLLHVPWLGIEPATLVFQDDAPTHWVNLARASTPKI